MTNITRSPEAVNREFTQAFDDLVSRVFGKDVVHKRVFGWDHGLHGSWGYFKGWNLYDRTKNRPKNPILRGLGTLLDFEVNLSGNGPLLVRGKIHSKQLVGRIEAAKYDDQIGPDADDLQVNETRIQRYRPSMVRLDSPTLLEPTKRFVEEYRALLGVELPIQTNY